MGYITAIIASGIAAILCFLGAFSSWNREYDADQWQTTTGRIISSELHIGDIEGKSRRLSTATRRPLCTLLIQYEYVVDGKNYTSNLYSLQSNPKSNISKDTGEPAPWLKDLAEKLSVGQECTVYYAPQRPQLSVLARKHTNMKFISLAVGIVFILICAGMTYTWLKTRGS
jgi:hypothetical protein